MTDTTAAAPRESQVASLLRHSRHVLAENPVTGFAFALFLLIVLAAVFGPQIAPYDPLASNTAQALKPPNAQHWSAPTSSGVTCSAASSSLPGSTSSSRLRRWSWFS